MQMFTIQCRLCTDEETRRNLWEGMEKYTLLVNELLEKIAQDPQFPQWQKQGSISKQAVQKILDPLKKHSSYTGLPSRFYSSAEAICCETYQSWLALQKKRQLQLEGKIRWVKAVATELELAFTYDIDPETIETQAAEIREQAKQEIKNSSQADISLINVLLDWHDQTDEKPLQRRAINHLLTNHLKVSKNPLNLDKISEKLHQKTIEIERLEKQLKSRLPKGRDPTGERYLENLRSITELPIISDDPEQQKIELEKLSQQQQLSWINPLLYPVCYQTSGDLRWSVESKHPLKTSSTRTNHTQSSKPQKERIFVQFSGLKKSKFKIQCDRRQLPLFRRFLTDYQTYKQLPKDQRFSEGLFTLRSVQLLWRKDNSEKSHKRRKKADRQNSNQPWNTHRLYLHCTVGQPLLTAEGTEQVREVKKQKVLQTLKGKETLSDSELSELGLTSKKIDHVKRQRTSLNRLQNNPPPPRPSASSFQGQPQIVMGLSFHRQHPLALAIVDIEKKEVLECQTTQELLNRGKAKYICKHSQKEILIQDGIERRHPNGGKLYTRRRKSARSKLFRLIEKLHQQRRDNSRRRTLQQRQYLYRQSKSESNLGAYTERLIANRLVKLAGSRGVSTIRIPNLKNIRESIESDIQAQAERRYPDQKERQKKYAKHYRASFHRWSYQRLSEYIHEYAEKQGLIVVVEPPSKNSQFRSFEPFIQRLKRKAIEVALSGDPIQIIKTVKIQQ